MYVFPANKILFKSSSVFSYYDEGTVGSGGSWEGKGRRISKRQKRDNAREGQDV